MDRCNRYLGQCITSLVIPDLHRQTTLYYCSIEVYVRKAVAAVGEGGGVASRLCLEVCLNATLVMRGVNIIVHEQTEPQDVLSREMARGSCAPILSKNP